MEAAAKIPRVEILDRTVVFDFETLERIEDATGRTVNDILLNEIRAFAPADDATETRSAAATAALAKISVRFVRRFLAGALRVPLEQLQETVPIGRTMPTFLTLVGAFAEAVAMMNGMGQEHDPGSGRAIPQEASGESGPSLGSSSV